MRELKDPTPSVFFTKCQIICLEFYHASLWTNIISDTFVVFWWLIIEQMPPSPLWADFNHNLMGKILTNYFTAFEQPQWAVMIQYSCQRLTSTHHNSEHLIRVYARKDFHSLKILEKKILPSPKHSLLHNETLKATHMATSLSFWTRETQLNM